MCLSTRLQGVAVGPFYAAGDRGRFIESRCLIAVCVIPLVKAVGVDVVVVYAVFKRAQAKVAPRAGEIYAAGSHVFFFCHAAIAKEEAPLLFKRMRGRGDEAAVPAVKHAADLAFFKQRIRAAKNEVHRALEQTAFVDLLSAAFFAQLIAQKAVVACDQVIGQRARKQRILRGGKAAVFHQKIIAQHRKCHFLPFFFGEQSIVDDGKVAHRHMIGADCHGIGAEGVVFAAETFDLETLADWMVLQAYFTNYDLPGNIRYIQTQEGGLWKIAFFDIDFGLRSEAVTWQHIMDPVNEFGSLTRTVLAQPEFQDILFRRMAELYKSGLCEETLIGILNDYGDTIEPELEREYERWGEGRGDLAVTKAELAEYIQSNRQSRCLAELCTAIGLDEAAVRAKYFGGMELE